MKGMTIMYRIGAVIMLALGILMCALEYIIISAVAAIAAGIAGWVGATGSAAAGITVLAYVAVIGLILSVAVAAVLSFYVMWWLFRN